MKNKRAIVMLGLAVLFGLAAVAVAWRYLLPPPPSSGKRVVVATVAVAQGKPLTADMLKLSDKIFEHPPEGSYFDTEKLLSRVVKDALAAGDPVTEAKLAARDAGLSSLIGKGNRAITVRVNDVIGVAGFALPGNYVDVIVSTQKDAPNGERSTELNVSKIVLERILVLAVAQDVGRDESKPRVVNAVTLEVTPAQAEHLDLARSVGTLSLALRNQLDNSDVHSDGATKRTLLQEPALIKPAVVVMPKAPARPTTRPVVLVKRNCVGVLNGVNVSQECF
ncbi:Flp pilus assembly protein CpaB [Massilia sp. DWR3-1-1]|uniref:Flp pilus assembly protein CpaB n=1 Tax=Massilia sp. DWR3-1-1 TaxID=2804559 RepID=UPI003CFA78B3